MPISDEELAHRMLEELGKQQRALAERVRYWRDELEAIHTQQAERLDAQQALTDPEVARKLVTLAWSDGIGNKVAQAKLDALVKSFGPGIGTEWAMDETDNKPILGAQLYLTRDQAIKPTADALRKWYMAFGGEQAEVHVRILGHTASENGSYDIYWIPATNAAELMFGWGSGRSLASGPLEQVLHHAAKVAWLYEPVGGVEE